MGLLTLNELAGLGQISECGPAPALGPGEKMMCCPDIGWVIYDQYENTYALCERAAGAGAAMPGAPRDYFGEADARRRAAEAEMDARRREIEDRRIALEERQFQRQVQAAMLQRQLQKVTAKRSAELAKVAAKRQHELSVIQMQEDARKKEQTRKALTYGAIALAAAKMFALF